MSIRVLGIACLPAYENLQNLQGNYFLRFSPLTREILHAWRESGMRNSVQGETPSQCGRVRSPVISRIWPGIWWYRLNYGLNQSPVHWLVTDTTRFRGTITRLSLLCDVTWKSTSILGPVIGPNNSRNSHGYSAGVRTLAVPHNWVSHCHTAVHGVKLDSKKAL